MTPSYVAEAPSPQVSVFFLFLEALFCFLGPQGSFLAPSGSFHPYIAFFIDSGPCYAIL